jgi:PleD family two-component response regulator
MVVVNVEGEINVQAEKQFGYRRDELVRQAVTTARTGFHLSVFPGGHLMQIIEAKGGTGMPVEVLLVEDNAGDVRLTQEAFKEANMAIRFRVASDGVEAMTLLRREGPHKNAPRPDLVLLDLNLPRMDGREVLAHIKQDEV